MKVSNKLSVKEKVWRDKIELVLNSPFVRRLASFEKNPFPHSISAIIYNSSIRDGNVHSTCSLSKFKTICFFVTFISEALSFKGKKRKKRKEKVCGLFVVSVVLHLLRVLHFSMIILKVRAAKTKKKNKSCALLYGKTRKVFFFPGFSRLNFFFFCLFNFFYSLLP